MGVVLLQILQWILRIILFLLLLIVVFAAIIMIVPVRYRAEGEVLEKKPGIQGKITWFFYLIYMRFAYEDDLHIIVRIFGVKVFDSWNENEPKKVKKNSDLEENPNVARNVETTVNETTEKVEDIVEDIITGQTENTNKELSDLRSSSLKKEETEYSLSDFEKEIEAEKEEETKRADKVIQNQTTFSTNEEDNVVQEEKKSLLKKIEDIKLKVREIIQKVKEIISKIQEGKLKIEHYLELWNRKETQVTFNRAKNKFGKMIKAILPRKWNLVGEIGFVDPAATGQLMGVLGVIYPIVESHVQIIPNFEEEVMNIKGNVKGHIRLGNLLYQLLSLILNIHCFKFIKLVLDELSGSKKNKK